MQIDVGFGDAIVPGPIDVEFPTLLARIPGSTARIVYATPDRLIAITSPRCASSMRSSDGT